MYLGAPILSENKLASVIFSSCIYPIIICNTKKLEAVLMYDNRG